MGTVGPADCEPFTQLQGVCSEGNTVCVTGVATGSLKLITGISGTAEFLQHRGSLYDSFGIHSKDPAPDSITIRQ